MSNHLGEFFKNRRLEKGLGFGHLARTVGYRNVTKGARKIQLLEQRGIIREDLLLKLVEVLGIDPSIVLDLAEKDRQEFVREWEAWADQPVAMEAVIRVMAAVYSTHTMPEEVKTQDEAEAYCSDLAKRLHKKVFLMVSRRLTINFDEQGVVTSRNVATPDRDPRPCMQIGKTKFLMHFEKLGQDDSSS